MRTGDDWDLVLKVGVPHRDFTTEMEALAIYAGRGINRLVEVDRDLNAMLLERLKPGTMLAQTEMDRSEQFETAAHIIRQLHETPPPSTHGLPHFSDWVESARHDAHNCEGLRRSDPYLEQFPRVQSMMERMFAGTFCDLVTSCSWGLKHEEDEGEVTGRETLAMVVEIARDIDDAKL